MQDIFKKHYDRTVEDLKQVQGFTPVMMKIVSFNYNKLKQDITKHVNNNHEGVNNYDTIRDYDR